ncbi:MAG TPA: hypothetical protein VGS80_01250 [Ktedonobacterales bacterium]|nr:hypothetical protein [Ktedonobacterales bacterium]
MEANGGLLLALDGIQPDKGHETIYLIRDLLSGHLLGAHNVLSSEAAVLQEVLLAPLAAWGLPVLGVLTDGQESLLQAVAATWPGVPHEICHFHALREAGRLLYERDRAIKVQLRTVLQSRIRTVRRQLDRRGAAASPDEADDAPSARILAEYAAGLQAVINRDGLHPFRLGAVAMDDALGEVEQSWVRLAKGGSHPRRVRQPADPLRTLLGLRAPFAADLACLGTGQAWLLDADALLTTPCSAQRRRPRRRRCVPAGARVWRAARAGCHRPMPSVAPIAWACSPACSPTGLPGRNRPAGHGPTLTSSASSGP